MTDESFLQTTDKEPLHNFIYDHFKLSVSHLAQLTMLSSK